MDKNPKSEENKSNSSANEQASQTKYSAKYSSTSASTSRTISLSASAKSYKSKAPSTSTSSGVNTEATPNHSSEAKNNQNQSKQEQSSSTNTHKHFHKFHLSGGKICFIALLILLAIFGAIYYFNYNSMNKANEENDLTQKQVLGSNKLGKKQDDKFLKAERKYHFVASLPYPKEHYPYLSISTNYNSYYLTHKPLPPYEVNDNTASDSKSGANHLMSKFYRKVTSEELTKDDSYELEHLAKTNQYIKPSSLISYAKQHHIDIKNMKKLLSKSELEQPHYWNYYFNHAHYSVKQEQHDTNKMIKDKL